MKNVIKTISLAAAAALLAGALAACGNSGTTTTTAAGNDATTAAPAETTTAAPAGETYDVGSFTLFLPSGWTAFPQTDMWGEQDAEGNYPIDPTKIYISDKAKTELDLFSEPYMNIVYYSKDTTIMSSKDWYEDVTDINIAINGKAADEAFRGTSYFDEDYVYDVVQFSTDDAQFLVATPYSIKGEETGYAIDNAAIMEIIESLKAN